MKAVRFDVYWYGKRRTVDGFATREDSRIAIHRDEAADPWRVVFRPTGTKINELFQPLLGNRAELLKRIAFVEDDAWMAWEAIADLPFGCGTFPPGYELAKDLIMASARK